MTGAARERRVLALCDAALDLEPGKRTVFLAEACGADLLLLHEVQALLARITTTKSFLTPAMRAAEPSPTAAFEFAGTGRFAVLRQVGAGGMGVVYEALDRERGIRVALKILPLMEPRALSRFKREFRALAAIDHPNLVRLYELISDGDLWFFTMELVEGVDFLSYLRGQTDFHLADEYSEEDSTATAAPSDTPRSPRPIETIRPILDGAPPIEDVDQTPIAVFDDQRLRGAFAQLVNGVSAIHAAGSLHRDLKPTNVLVSQDARVVVLDFGLVGDVRGVEDSDSRIIGTVAYMSPEQASGERLTAASDWYSVGVMLYEALTGRRPFRGNVATLAEAKRGDTPVPPAVLSSSIPADLSQLCMRLFHRDPSMRPVAAELIVHFQAKAAAESSQRTLGRTSFESPAFVGRQPQLRALAEALDRVAGGAGVTVQIQGRSGFGKTTLVSQFLEDISQRSDVVVLSGRCYEQESVPYKAVDSLIDAMTRYLCRQPARVADSLIPPDSAALSRVFPVLRRVGPIARAAEQAPPTPDLQVLRRRAFGAFRELVARVAARTRLVLWIDDLQWGDADSAALLTDLLQPPVPPFLLLVSYRSEDLETSACLAAIAREQQTRSASTVLVVDQLDGNEARELAWSILRGRVPDAGAEADRIAQDSDGNPYFISELANDVVAEHVRPDRVSPSVALRLDDVVWHRVEQLPSSARRLLEVLAVAGQPLQVRTAYESAELTELAHEPVAILKSARLVRSSGPRAVDSVQVYHDRIRESVTAHLGVAVTERHHGRLARALEMSGQADAETVAAHFEQARELEPARRHYARAARAAADALAFVRAARLFRHALDLFPAGRDEQRELQVQLGDVLAHAGRGADAAAVYLEAAEGVGAEASFQLRRLAATQFCVSGHIDEGRRLFRELLSQVGVQMPSGTLRGLLEWLLGRARLSMRGLSYVERSASDLPADRLKRIDTIWWCTAGLSAVDVVGVAALHTRCLLLSLEAGEPYRLARSLAWEAALASADGGRSAGRVEQLLGQARALAERIDEPHAYGMVTLASGWIAFLQLRLEDALRHSSEAETIFRDRCTGVWWELGNTRTMTAWSLVHRGEANELARIAPIYLADARERGDLFTMTNLTAVATPYLKLVADDPEAARRAVAGALELWPHEGFHIQHVSVLFSRVHLELYAGDGEAAWRQMSEMWPTFRRSVQFRNQLARVMLRDLRARSASAAARSGLDCNRLLRIAEAEARRIGGENAAWARPFALRAQAGVDAARGHSSEAAAKLEAAATRFDALDLKLHAAACRWRVGQWTKGSQACALIERAEQSMREEGVTNIRKMTDMYAPAL